jgi:uncharacterized protein
MKTKPAVISNPVSHWDGWGNVITGMGQQGVDRKESTNFAAERRLTESDCRDLYTYSGLAARIVDLPVYDGLRKWFTVDGDTDNLTENEFKRIGGKLKIRRAWRWSRVYGGSMIVILAKDGGLLTDPLNESNIQEIEKLEVYHRWRTNRISYYMDPAHPKYGETELYIVNPTTPFGQQSFTVHESRCIIFDGEDVAPEIRMGNNWWGDSVYQRIYQRLRGLGEAYSNIEHIIGEFTLLLTKIKGLSQKLAENKGQEMIARAMTNNLTRHLMGSYMVDADGEDATRLTTSVSGIEKLMETLMMSVSAETAVPIRRLFGSPISGAGLSNNGDAETTDYYDMVIANREENCLPQLEKIVRLLMLQKRGSFGGRELENWQVNFPPLKEETMEQQLKNKKTQLDIDRGYWDMEVVDGPEVRENRFGGDSYSHDMVLSKKRVEPKEEAEETEFEGLTT